MGASGSCHRNVAPRGHAQVPAKSDGADHVDRRRQGGAQIRKDTDIEAIDAELAGLDTGSLAGVVSETTPNAATYEREVQLAS